MERYEQLNLFSATDSPRDMEQITLFFHDSNTPLQNEANSKADPAMVCTWWRVCVSWGAPEFSVHKEGLQRDISVG